jgi:5S rRNA maturation endonuclease (ribonuclease M5)
MVKPFMLLSKIKMLKSLSKKASTILLATDPDREGEAIAWHIKEAIGLKDAKRVAFHEITESSDNVWIEGFEKWQEFVTDTISGKASGEVTSVDSRMNSFRLDKSFNFCAIERRSGAWIF